MKRIINGRFIGIALFSILITTLSMTGVFYAQLEKQVFSDLEIAADLVAETNSYKKPIKNMRITIIEKDGSVSYDSMADVKTMENHKSRPEITEAMKLGKGREIRMSDTLSETTFYYAIKLESGQILRVGKETHSVFSVLWSAFPVIISMAIFLSVISLIVSNMLTEKIVKPIDEMVDDMDHINDKEIYAELIPFTKKIQSQHEEILKATNMRQEFTANVTHELKTPLAAISGYAELMESGMVSEEDTKHFAKEIRKSAGRLLTLINDIIKLSELDADEVDKILEPVNLADVAKETVQMLSMGAKKQDVNVFYTGSDDVYVRIGKEFAHELTYNLIENAIRYNKPGGEVDVSVTTVDGKTTFQVRDTGIGISPKHQNRVFERFYRVDKSRSKELGGTGLGLAIVKHICNLTQGALNLESELGKGTCITIQWLG